MQFTRSEAVDLGHAYADIELRDWFRDGNKTNSIALLGWAATATGRATNVEFYQNGTLIAFAPLAVERPDVVAALPEQVAELRCGFHLRISKLLLDPSGVLDVVLYSDRNGEPERTPLGRLVGVPTPRLMSKYRERYNPLLVLGMGRSGTSRLMELLSGRPELLVPGPHPYEFGVANYLWHAAHVLSAPADHAGSMGPDAFTSRLPNSVGFNPYRHHEWEPEIGSEPTIRWMEDEMPLACIDFCKRQVDAFGDSFVADRSVRPRYIAQKMPLSPARYFVSNIYPGAREIFLVRDFRDVWLSARSFNRRRGTASFGRDQAVDDLAWMRGLGHSSRELRLAHQASGHRSLLVHYEDLVDEPEAELLRIFRWLSVDQSPEAVASSMRANDEDAAGAHRTTPRDSASAGRWKTEMTEQERELAAFVFGEDLAYFGYQVAEEPEPKKPGAKTATKTGAAKRRKASSARTGSRNSAQVRASRNLANDLSVTSDT